MGNYTLSFWWNGKAQHGRIKSTTECDSTKYYLVDKMPFDTVQDLIPTFRNQRNYAGDRHKLSAVFGSEILEEINGLREMFIQAMGEYRAEHKKNSQPQSIAQQRARAFLGRGRNRR